MNISNDLRQAVLQAAIQGKLTKQLPEDGNAKDLLEQIKEEKAKLIKEGKLKKEKPLPEITEDEKPFDIPDNWEWVRLGAVSTYGNTKKKINAQDALSDIWLLDLEDIEKGGTLLQKKTVAESKAKGEKTVFEKGNILYSKLRPYLLKIIEVDDSGICTPELIPFSMYGKIENQYIIGFLKSPYVDIEINQLTYGVKMPRVGTETMLNFLLPLPPLSEQKRIVAKVEELMAKIDELEKTEKELDSLKKAFPADMKASLLKAAMQGKAKDLLEQIKAEKAKLVKEGKLKKEKPLPEITEDEIPFDIPENWEWVRLGEVASIFGGKRIPAGRTLTTEDTGHKYIRVSDMKNESVVTDGLMYVPEDIFPTISRYIINKEDVYITVAGTIGRVGKIPVELDGANLTENADRIVFKRINQDWLIKCIGSMVVQSQILDVTTKVGQPKLAIKRIQELIIPLPPLAEQKRIVEKLEKLLPLCDGLEG